MKYSQCFHGGGTGAWVRPPDQYIGQTIIMSIVIKHRLRIFGSFKSLKAAFIVALIMY